MTVVLAICVAVVFTVSTFMILGQELKGIAIGVFLLGHAANLSIIAMSGSPIAPQSQPPDPKNPPLIQHVAAEASEGADHGAAHGAGHGESHGASTDAEASIDTEAHTQASAQAGTEGKPTPPPLDDVVDPLPQALILTAIVIGFGVMGFLLTLIVVTSRSTQTLNLNDLSREQLPTPSKDH